MIDLALQFLRDQANAYLRDVLATGAESPLAFSTIASATGENAITSRLGLALIKVEEERTQRSQVRHEVVNGGVVYYTEPDLRLNLYVLIAANPETVATGEALRSIAAVVSFFQAQASFSQDVYPALAPIEKLQIVMESLDFESQNHIWGALGAKYVPSVVYKVSMITIQRGVVQARATPILTVDVKTGE